MALTEKLSNIGDAVRAKTGGTELMTLDEMAAAITAIEGGECTKHHIPDEALVVSGSCPYMFSYGNWDWFIEECGSEITTVDITNAINMFMSASVDEIPFKINMKSTVSINMTSIFDSSDIKNAPTINIPNAEKINFQSVLRRCKYIRDLNGFIENEEEFGASFQGYVNTNAYSGVTFGNIFHSCYSLRAVPTWFYQLKLNPESTVYPYSSYTLYYYLFGSCFALDEITNLPVWKCQGYQTSNMFSEAFTKCSRLKDVTFETDDGAPIVTEWKSQIIDLTSYVGYSSSPNDFLLYNSGLTIATRVTDDASYQALKNDPDWWTIDVAYSRYNHDSAVNTINSLPDTSAYLATAGGTNTIKFKGAAGSATDGGAINTLTEEEIAVATAKGWTVSLV